VKAYVTEKAEITRLQTISIRRLPTRSASAPVSGAEKAEA
jgi:hypothetical protein